MIELIMVLLMQAQIEDEYANVDNSGDIYCAMLLRGDYGDEIRYTD